MKKHISGGMFLCLLVAVANGANVTTANCSNPVFENPLRYGFKQFPGMQKYPLFPRIFKPEKWPTSDNKVCKFLANNQDQSCCSAQTLQDIEKAIGVAKEYVQLERFSMLNQSLVFYQKTFKNRFNGMIALLCGLKANCYNEMKQLVTDYENKLISNFDQLTKLTTKCTTQLLNYFEGMLCFACDANWPQFVRKNRIVIAQASCTGIVSACQPLYSQMASFNQLTENFVNSVLNTLKIESPGARTIFSKAFSVDWPDACGGTFSKPGDCKDFSCDTILNGVGLPYNAINRWTPWRHFNPYGARRLADDATVNIYSSDGYDALHVGCASNGNCEDTPNAGVTTHPPSAGGVVAGVLIVILVLAGAAVGGFFLWKKLKPSDNQMIREKHRGASSKYGSTTI